MFITSAPTVMPTVEPSDQPTTMIPSALPTITGAVASVSMSGSITEELTLSEINIIASELAEIYGVDSEDIATSIDYVTTGVLEITIPDNSPESEIIDALQTSLSDVLGVHVSDVVVTIDDGIISYAVSGESYKDIEAVQDVITDENFAKDLIIDLNESNVDIIVDSVSNNANIDVEIYATVDTTDSTITDDPSIAIEALTESLDLTESTVEQMFITSAPTLIPTMSPITSLPTMKPSFIGLVISIEITTTTTRVIGHTEVEELEATVAQAYGVDAEDVTSITTYTTSGTLDVSIPDDVSQEVALAELTTALAETLGVNEDDVSLTVDPITSEVAYVISTEEYDATFDIQQSLGDSAIVEEIINAMENISVELLQVNEEIIAAVNVIVDGDEVEISLQQAENRMDVLLGDEYSAETNGISSDFVNEVL